MCACVHAYPHQYMYRHTQGTCAHSQQVNTLFALICRKATPLSACACVCTCVLSVGICVMRSCMHIHAACCSTACKPRFNSSNAYMSALDQRLYRLWLATTSWPVDIFCNYICNDPQRQDALDSEIVLQVPSHLVTGASTKALLSDGILQQLRIPSELHALLTTAAAKADKWDAASINTVMSTGTSLVRSERYD